MQNSELLSQLRWVIKYFEYSGREVMEKYGLNQTELDILAFLGNNPGLDTARDIAEMRMLQKANISQTVEGLIRKGLLVRSRDSADRRRIHLTCTEKALGIMPDIKESRQRFAQVLFQDFSDEEKEIYANMNARMAANAEGAIGRKRGFDAGRQ